MGMRLAIQSILFDTIFVCKNMFKSKQIGLASHFYENKLEKKTSPVTSTKFYGILVLDVSLGHCFNCSKKETKFRTSCKVCSKYSSLSSSVLTDNTSRKKIGWAIHFNYVIRASEWVKKIT